MTYSVPGQEVGHADEVCRRQFNDKGKDLAATVSVTLEKTMIEINFCRKIWQLINSTNG